MTTPDAATRVKPSPSPTPAVPIPPDLHVVGEAAAIPSQRGGMGAIPYVGDGETGVAFRVWAPHAAAVSVAGTWNDFDPARTPLAADEDGAWSADVAEARVGHEYRFVVRTADGVDLDRRDPYAAEIAPPKIDAVSGLTVRNCVVDDPEAFDWGDEPWFMPAWNELVIYELHVGTFNDPPGGPPGMFDSVCARLPYLADLGVNCIEIMPSVEFAGDFSWGYNPADIFAIESAYGGPCGMKMLIREAHRHGIAVIFDVVYNHFGPGDLDLWRFDGWAPDEGEGPRGGIWFYNDARALTPWGHTRPDYGVEQVRRFIRSNALRWLEEFRLDGLRWDATAYIRNANGNNDDRAHDLGDGWSLMQEITRETDLRQGWKLHIAEDLRGNGWIVRDVELGGAGFDTQWDGDFVHPVRRAVIELNDWQRSMAEVRGAIEGRFEGDPFKRVIYTESHDEVANGHARVPEEIWPGNAGSWYSRKRSTLGAALVFTAPGIPMLFQGQEILEDHWFTDGEPVDWTRLDTFAGIHLLYRDLMRLRRDWWDTTRGLRGPHVHVHHVNDDDKVIAFHRWENGGPRDDVMVLLNFGDRAYDAYWTGFPRDGEWKVRLNSDWTGYGDDYAGTPSLHTRADGGPMHDMPFSAPIGIGSYTCIILSQDD